MESSPTAMLGSVNVRHTGGLSTKPFSSSTSFSSSSSSLSLSVTSAGTSLSVIYLIGSVKLMFGYFT